MRVEIGVVFRPPGVLHSCMAPPLRPALQAVFRKARWLTLLAPFFDRLTADDTIHGYPPVCLFVSCRSLLIEVQKNELGECVFLEGQSGWKRRSQRLGHSIPKADFQISTRVAHRRLGGSRKVCLPCLTAIG